MYHHSLFSGRKRPKPGCLMNSSMSTPSQAVFDRFLQVFLLYGKFHDIYNSNIVDDTTIAQLGEAIITILFLTYLQFPCHLFLELTIQEFLSFYRSNFPSSTVTPKMHLLEDHTVPWLKRWLLGTGLMGEQGAESIHSHVKKLEANYSGITNRLDRLKYIFNEYMLETAPCLQNLKPPLKRRKTS